FPSIVRLLLQFFDEQKLPKAKQALQDETAVTLNTVVNKDVLHQQIQQGQWDTVLDQVIRLDLPPKSLMDLFEHVILELAEIGELTAARSLLRQTQPMYILKQQHPERYLHLEHILSRTVLDPHDLYPGRSSKEKRRNAIANDICSEVTLAAPNRLMTLLDQSFQWQEKHGLCTRDTFDVFAGGTAQQNTTILPMDEDTTDTASTHEDPCFPGGDTYAECVHILHDGQSLVTGSVDGFIEVWHLHNGKRRKDLRFQAEKNMMTMDESVISLASSADDELLVSGATNGKISIWKLQSGFCRRRISPAHSQGVSCLAIDPTAKHILSGSYDQLVKVHDIKTGKLLHEFSGHTSVVNTVRYKDASTILSGSTDATIKIWNSDNGTCLGTFTLPAHAPVQWISPFPASTHASRRDQMLVCDKSRQLTIMDARDGSVVRSLPAPGDGDSRPGSDIISAALSVHGDVAYALTEEGLLHAYQVDNGASLAAIKVSDQELIAMVSSPVSDYVAVNDAVGYVSLLKPA
ncbi:WD40-repeat-containing domain protein, partial [Gongronella butleri]